MRFLRLLNPRFLAMWPYCFFLPHLPFFRELVGDCCDMTKAVLVLLLGPSFNALTRSRTRPASAAVFIALRSTLLEEPLTTIVCLLGWFLPLTVLGLIVAIVFVVLYLCVVTLFASIGLLGGAILAIWCTLADCFTCVNHVLACFVSSLSTDYAYRGCGLGFASR
jgi:hypothetical protein